MTKEKKMPRQEILRINRTKEQAEKAYDKLSGVYDVLAGPFEKKYRDYALKLLNIGEGEEVLEVGFGTGDCLRQIAEIVGSTGKACGIDISPGMMRVAEKRLARAGLSERVELRRGDATELPFEDNRFDASFMSFTLELFDTPHIPRVLAEIKRVLKPGGRLGVVSMSKENGDSFLLMLYEKLHKAFPHYIDCRPIYLEHSLREVGFEITHKERLSFFGLPGETVVGVS